MLYDELFIIFGLLAAVGVGIMILRALTIPIVVAVVVGITGWLGFLYQLGLDNAQ